MKMFKCPFCGNHHNEAIFVAHVFWKHDHTMEGDLNRFLAPTYGLGTDNGLTWQRHANAEVQKKAAGVRLTA